MECYVSFEMKALEKYREELALFIKSAGDYEMDAAFEALRKMDQEALGKYERMLSNDLYGEYASEFETVDIKENSIQLSTVTGSMGFEFAIAFIDFIAPYCKEITGVYSHDEDFDDDENWPIRLEYREGAVYANGSKTEVVTSFSNDYEDMWDEDPKLSKKTLQPIRSICKKVSSDSNFSLLAQIYKELFKPITSIGSKHKSLLNEHLPEEESIEGLVELQNLEAVKKNHPSIGFFINKMYGNLEKMAGCEYFGSILSEYNKTLALGSLIAALHDEASEENFEDVFGDVDNQDLFNALYEFTALYALVDE